MKALNNLFKSFEGHYQNMATQDNIDEQAIVELTEEQIMPIKKERDEQPKQIIDVCFQLFALSNVIQKDRNINRLFLVDEILKIAQDLKTIDNLQNKAK